MERSYASLESHHVDVQSPRAHRDVAVVRLLEEADLHAAPRLRDALDKAIATGAGLIVIDLTGVTVVDSMVLRVILGVSRQTRSRGTSTRIVTNDPHVRRMFELTLLDRVLPLYSTVELAAADRSVRR